MEFVKVLGEMTSDPFDLGRFVEAQAGVYERALEEVRAGRKRTHWMWFIFPQFAGLGHSAMAERYAIRSLDEARAYLAHPLLGARLRECAAAALGVEGPTAREVFGDPDDLKLRSCATLFALVSAEGNDFQRLLDKYYEGAACEATRRLAGWGVRNGELGVRSEE